MAACLCSSCMPVYHDKRTGVIIFRFYDGSVVNTTEDEMNKYTLPELKDQWRQNKYCAYKLVKAPNIAFNMCHTFCLYTYETLPPSVVYNRRPWQEVKTEEVITNESEIAFLELTLLYFGDAAQASFIAYGSNNELMYTNGTIVKMVDSGELTY